MNEFSSLKDVPSPDDDDSPRSVNAIESCYIKNEAGFLFLAEQLGFNPDTPNFRRHIISFCYNQNTYFWEIMNKAKAINASDLENCIKQIKDLNINNPYDLLKVQEISHTLGLAYRREYNVIEDD